MEPHEWSPTERRKGQEDTGLIHRDRATRSRSVGTLAAVQTVVGVVVLVGLIVFLVSKIL